MSTIDPVASQCMVSLINQFRSLALGLDDDEQAERLIGMADEILAHLEDRSPIDRIIDALFALENSSDGNFAMPRVVIFSDGTGRVEDSGEIVPGTFFEGLMDGAETLERIANAYSV
jgi:hypothetical protein